MRLDDGDYGRSVIVTLCTAIWVTGPQGMDGFPEQMQSSDDSILSIVPLPTPAGMTVFLAQRTGSAVLSSILDPRSCPSSGVCPRWTVYVTVAP